jgi:DNA-binding GntR family transcriptional regulator
MSKTFERIEPISKKTRVVTMLRQAILSGTVRGGEQIVEAKLAQEFGVGQCLIREALIELEHHGFLQRTPFTGTMVTTLTTEDARQIFEVRIELEPLAFSLAAKRASEQDMAILDTIVDKTKRDAKVEDLEAFFESHLEFRKKVWQTSGNRYVQQALERVVIPLYALYLIRRPYNREGILQTVSECIGHQDRILDAMRRNDSETAGQAARDFLVRMKEYLGTSFLPEVGGDRVWKPFPHF